MSKYISYIFQIFLSSKKTRNEKFRNKKEISLSSQYLTLPSPPTPAPPLRAGPSVKLHCLRRSFLLLVAVRHFFPFLCLSWFQSVWKYPHSAILLQYAVYSQYQERMSYSLLPVYSVNIYRFLDRLVLLSLL